MLLAAACIPILYHLAAATDPKRSKDQLILMVRKKERKNKPKNILFGFMILFFFTFFFLNFLLQTLVCCLYPLHFFYTFLYYTDVASTLFTLSAWLAARKGSYRLAGLLGAFAVLMRQTNSVWVAFIAARSIIEICLLDSNKAGKEKTSTTNLTTDIPLLLQQAWILRTTLLSQLWPLLTVVLGFAAFVLHNGGIVVGDKDNHVPVRHLMQPLYFVLYCTICLAPAYWTPKAMKRTLSKTFNSTFTTSLLISLATLIALAVSKGTLVHPFLLADNRHYPFYLWRRVVNYTPWMRYALIPAYIYSILALNALFAGSCGKRAGQRPIERVLFAATVAIVLVPAHLIEFRYYTIAFYAVFMMSSTPSVAALAVTAGGFAIVNAVTLYVFAMRPFQWGDGSVARFLW